jgi:hypothetical protein
MNSVCIISGIAHPLNKYVVNIGNIRQQIEINIDEIPILKSVFRSL